MDPRPCASAAGALPALPAASRAALLARAAARFDTFSTGARRWEASCVAAKASRCQRTQCDASRGGDIAAPFGRQQSRQVACHPKLRTFFRAS